MKKHIKKIVSVFLAVSMLLSTNVFAASPTLEDSRGIGNTTYIAGNKIVFEENGNKLSVTQYDSNNNLVEVATYDKDTKEATGYNKQQGAYRLDLDKLAKVVSMAATKTEAKESVLTDRTIQESMTTESAFNITPLLKSASVPSGYKYIDTIGATKYGETKLNNMEVYYSRVYDGVTTYSITSYKGSIAALALSLVVSLAIPQLAASEFISELIKYGLGSLVGSVLSINSSRTFAATEYVYHYFGSDIGSSKCAYWKNAGSEYYIIDKNYTSAKTTYYDNYTYTGSTSDNIFWDICDTLAYRVYGASCELDF